MDVFIWFLPLIGVLLLFLAAEFFRRAFEGVTFNLVPVSPAVPPQPSRSDDELVARVLAALRSDDVWLDQTLSAFVQIVQREERDAIAGVYSRDEATRRIESATLHFQRAILLRNLCVTTDPSPEAQEEATS